MCGWWVDIEMKAGDRRYTITTALTVDPKLQILSPAHLNPFQDAVVLRRNRSPGGR